MTKYCTPHTKQKLMPSSTKSQVLTSFLLDLILFQACTYNIDGDVYLYVYVEP